MMASHRSTDPLPLEQPKPVETPSPAPGHANLSALPPSGVIVGIDWILCFAVLALGFILASFTARNSDFFMHIATGRLLSEGGYSFGKDPFSYVGGDRSWVNHSWLFDWIFYRLYSSAGGSGVVIAKAIVVALAGGLLLLARKPGQFVFPAVICAVLALIAAAPWLMLRPTIASVLGISVLMALLVRAPKIAGSWRFPACIAVLFATWANLDQWFFLGPVLLLLYTVGQLIRRDDGVDLHVLWKALGLGILACTVNPHHIRVWALPPELADASVAEALRDDVEFGAMFRSAFSKGGLDFSGERDNPTNLYCLIAILALNLVGFAANYKRASLGLALVWVGATVLALMHLRAIPFLAFVAAPVAALNLTAALLRFTEVRRTERTIRAFLALRSVGRGVALIAVIVLIAPQLSRLAPSFREPAPPHGMGRRTESLDATYRGTTSRMA